MPLRCPCMPLARPDSHRSRAAQILRSERQLVPGPIPTFPGGPGTFSARSARMAFLFLFCVHVTPSILRAVGLLSVCVPMLAWTHNPHLCCRPWRLLAGYHLFRQSMEGRRWVISGPMRQVEQIFRSTALLNPALAPSHPYIVVLLSATRVCLAGQARPRPSARSRSGGAGDLRDLRECGYRRSPAHPMLAWHTCSVAAPVWAVHGGSAACLLCFCMHIHNI